jgi:hypothetical protein
MKRIYLATVLLSTMISNVDAQTFDWAKLEGKYAYDYGYGISTDVSGNVYVAGKYEEDGAFFSGTTVPCAGNHDMFLAKYTSDGSLVWVRTAGGVLGDYAHAMTTDRTNYIYVAGEIEGTNTTITFPGSTQTLTCVADNDIFLAKYDMNGNLIWAKSAGGGGGEKALGVTYDNAGNVYICGNYKDNFTYEGTPMVASFSGERDIFIAKYNSSGVFQWVKTAGSVGRDEALDIECNAAGEVYVCGMHHNNAVFGSTTLPTASTPSGHYMNAYIAKYASDGTLLWVKSDGSEYDDVAWDMTIDNSGKVYVAGEFNAYAIFGTQPALTTFGEADAYVACYDASGNVSWVTQAGGTAIDRIRGIGTDGTNLYVTGQFGTLSGGPAATFGSSSFTAVDSSDVFISGLNNSGSFLWTKTIGGIADSLELLGYESGNAICTDGTNTVYVTGALLNGGTLGSITLDDYKRTDAFITRLTVVVGVEELASENSLKVFPNPGTGNFLIDLKDIKSQTMDLRVYNYLGTLVEQKNTLRNNNTLNVDISSHNKGIYFIEIRTEDGIFREKIILQ